MTWLAFVASSRGLGHLDPAHAALLGVPALYPLTYGRNGPHRCGAGQGSSILP